MTTLGDSCCDSVIGPEAPPEPAQDAALALTVEELLCASTVDVGDLVVMDTVTPLTVIELTDNLATSAPTGIFGMVYRKRTPTLCDVLIQGKQDGFTGLLTGQPLWLQVDGSIGHAKPATDMLQHLGYAASSSKVILLPKTAIQQV